MAILTYITSTEATNRFPNDQDFSAAQRTQALEDSFRLVNSYISSAIKLPAVGQWDGDDGTINAPGTLKELQHRFYRYVLIFTYHGETDELREFFESTKEIAREITQNEINVPEVQNLQLESGWHITDVSNTGNKGSIEIRGNAPSLTHHYELEITSTGTQYPGDIEFKLTRGDSASDFATSLEGKYEWTAAGSAGFSLRFEGQWTDGDTVSIKGVPDDLADTPTKSSGIRQKSVLF